MLVGFCISIVRVRPWQRLPLSQRQLTDPVGRCCSLQFCQFCGVHYDIGSWIGKTFGTVQFGSRPLSQRGDEKLNKVQSKYVQIGHRDQPPLIGRQTPAYIPTTSALTEMSPQFFIRPATTNDVVWYIRLAPVNYHSSDFPLANNLGSYYRSCEPQFDRKLAN